MRHFFPFCFFMSSVVFLQLVGNKPEYKNLSLYVQLEMKNKNSLQVFLRAIKKVLQC